MAKYAIIVFLMLAGCAGFDQWLGIAPPPQMTEPDRPVRPTDNLFAERTYIPAKMITVCKYESGSSRTLRGDVLCPWRYFAD